MHNLIPSFWTDCVYVLYIQEAAADDNIDLLLENLEQSNGLSLQNDDSGVSDRRPVLHVEHR